MTTKLASVRQLNEHVVNLLSQALRAHCAECPGVPISYSDLEEAAGMSVTQSPGRHLLNKARARLLGEGVMFKVCRSVGLEVVIDDQKSELISSRSRKKISSTVKRWRVEHDAINPSGLSAEGVSRYLRDSVRLAYREDAESAQKDRALTAIADQAPLKTNDKELKALIRNCYREMAHIG